MPITENRILGRAFCITAAARAGDSGVPVIPNTSFGSADIAAADDAMPFMNLRRDKRDFFMIVCSRDNGGDEDHGVHNEGTK